MGRRARECEQTTHLSGIEVSLRRVERGARFGEPS
jgi:hypothetical protein